MLLGDDTRADVHLGPADRGAASSERGYRVVTVDISEFEKLEGCVTCLSVRLRGRPGGD